MLDVIERHDFGIVGKDSKGQTFPKSEPWKRHALMVPGDLDNFQNGTPRNIDRDKFPHILPTLNYLGLPKDFWPPPLDHVMAEAMRSVSSDGWRSRETKA